MGDSDQESIPLLQFGASVRNEDDLDESRETETTDDEGCETDVSYVEPSCSSVQTNKDDPSQNHSREREAGLSSSSCYLNEDNVPQSSNRKPEAGPPGSSRLSNDYDHPQCSSAASEAWPSRYSTNNDQSQFTRTEPVAGSSGLCRHLNNCSSCRHCAYREACLGQSSSSNSSQSSSSALFSLLKKGQEAFSYFAGDAVMSSSDSHRVSSNSSSVDLGCVIEYTLDEDGNVDYVDIDFDDTISEAHMIKLSKKIRLNHYTSISCEGDFTLSKCRGLFERDFYCEVIENPGGSLSQNYPARLIIPVARKSAIPNSERSDAPYIDMRSYHGKVKRSVFSRLLTRFVVPVILLDEKFICRSGSLTVRKTAMFESARQKEAPKDVEITASRIQQIARRLAGSLADFSNRTRRTASHLFFPNSMAKLRDVDAEIMRDLNIQHICDLMVEDRKMFKQTIRISSSEKINRNIFKDSAIEQMPYPGSSFFRRYHDADHVTRRLVYDWERPDVNVEMRFSVDPYEIFPDINWENYKEWDIVNLTRNYLKMILIFLVKDAGGMLIHCISGWDRTPLFISLLRMSLWADGLIHESLDYRDIAYLTLAYDWYLFGHNFPLKYAKKQEILHFCFNFLKYIATDEFSITKILRELPADQKQGRFFPKHEREKRYILKILRAIFHELPADQKQGRSFPEYIPDKRRSLKMLRAYVLEVYDEYIERIPTLI